VGLDDTAGDRERQADASALLVEGSSRGIVSGLYAGFVGDDNNG
jgi:hypothetical protein